jgi:hypothetical protein
MIGPKGLITEGLVIWQGEDFKISKYLRKWKKFGKFPYIKYFIDNMKNTTFNLNKRTFTATE